jgi:hypothetical protein
MKKINSLLPASLAAIVTALLVSVVLTSCSSPLNEQETSPQSVNPSSEVNLNYTVDDFNSAFAKAAFLTVHAAAASMELAKNAGVDLDAARTASRSANNEVQFSDLSSYMTTSSMRSADGGVNDLEAGLSSIADTYGADIAALLPDFGAAVSAGLLFIEDGEIVISDDQRIQLDSLDGIATVEVMNRVAAGERIEDVIADIQADIEKLLAQSEESERGLYIQPENAAGIGGTVSGARWINGLVKYHFETGDYSFDENAKKVARAAMSEWTNKTNGKVRFEEISPSSWNTFCKAIGQTQYLTIGLYNLKSGTSGNSTIGSVATSRMQIGYSYRETPRTYLHELGHTLGLIHEHQRLDRDNHITISSQYSSDKVNFGTIPDKTIVAGLKPVRIWFITIYLPYIWYLDYGKTVGLFDFQSIMLYSSPYIYRKSDNSKIESNVKLSDTDVLTVKKMY